ncbi:MAG: hypothetical protein FWJ93_08845 [Micromonosporaceae bacterium]
MALPVVPRAPYGYRGPDGLGVGGAGDRLAAGALGRAVVAATVGVGGLGDALGDSMGGIGEGPAATG